MENKKIVLIGIVTFVVIFIFLYAYSSYQRQIESYKIDLAENSVPVISVMNVLMDLNIIVNASEKLRHNELTKVSFVIDPSPSAYGLFSRDSCLTQFNAKQYPVSVIDDSGKPAVSCYISQADAQQATCVCIYPIKSDYNGYYSDFGKN